MKSTLKIFVIAFLVCATGTFTFAGSASTTYYKSFFETQDRKISGFHGVSSSGSFSVVLRQGTTESVRVEADAEVINDVVTEVKNGILLIHSKEKSGWSFGDLWNNRKVTVYITAKNLDQIGLSGSGDLRIEDEFNAGDLAMRVSGSGNCRGKINVKTVAISVSGSGNFHLSGKADESSVRISGSGNFIAENLITKTTAVRVSGSGNAQIYTSETLDASVSGSGNVHFSGNPKSVSKSKHGSGDISGS